jgi:putative addiction module component (TIGR02574 family)
MSHSLPPIDIQNLEPSQKLDLIAQLWDSLPNSTESIPMPEWHQRELDNRLAAADASPDAANSWDEVHQRLRKTN